MKRILYIVMLIVFTQWVYAQEQELTLIWSDEFDYEGLPSPDNWNYAEGFTREDQMQYYTRKWKENVRVENGMLVIEARKEDFRQVQPTTSGDKKPHITHRAVLIRGAKSPFSTDVLRSWQSCRKAGELILQSGQGRIPSHMAKLTLWSTLAGSRGGSMPTIISPTPTTTMC